MKSVKTSSKGLLACVLIGLGLSLFCFDGQAGELDRLARVARSQVSLEQKAPIKVSQISHLSELMAVVRAESLVAFDLDLTLLCPESPLGMPQWYGARIASYRQAGHKEADAYQLALADATGIYHLLRFRPCENDLSPLLARIHQVSAKTMAITARGYGLKLATDVHLSQSNLSFRSNFSLAAEQLISYQPRPLFFHHGVLYTAGQHKGRSLFRFLQFIKQESPHLVFVDDDRINIEHMRESCQDYGWSCDLYIYQGSQKLIADFSLKEAESLWASLRNLLGLHH